MADGTVAQLNPQEMAVSDSENDKDAGDNPEVVKAAANTAACWAIGYGAVSTNGMTAARVVGGGAGLGMSSGHVGTVVGAVAELALCGACRAFKGE